MYKYEISKYDPQFRDSNRRYLRDEWTAVSDIGKIFGNETLTIDSYKHAEDGYVNAIYVILEYAGIPYLSVRNVVTSFPVDRFHELTKGYRELYTGKILEVYTSVNSLERIEKEQVGNFLRLMLREDIGAEVLFEDRLQIFVGYDFLMGVQSSISLDDVVPKVESMGLFMEKF